MSLFCQRFIGSHNPEAKRNCKNECHPHEPEELEVDPGVGRTRVGDKEVDDPGDEEEADPGPLHDVPAALFHDDLAPEERLDEVAVRRAAVKEDRPENPVEDRGLPLDEEFVLEPQREAPEDDDHREADPEHRLDLLAAHEEPCDLQDRRENRHDRRDEDGDLLGRGIRENERGKLGARVGEEFGAFEGREKENDGT